MPMEEHLFDHLHTETPGMRIMKTQQLGKQKKINERKTHKMNYYQRRMLTDVVF